MCITLKGDLPLLSMSALLCRFLRKELFSFSFCNGIVFRDISDRTIVLLSVHNARCSLWKLDGV